ncbi:metal ABC transporter permease [Trueperella pecoris]|uniref:Metal ABC transporter permease n=1 Tax=Trueperella pecoris TaxID=2733571 RepID=A0A7M1QXV4_9ACTO|nr:metal ABC transporter permease [Trueperella pecoris]QOR46768.1 metal ABC transporter permease [Trueperella pecoris]
MISLAEFFGTYAFRTTAIGTFLIGALAGALGSILYLRKQSLASDVVGHSAIFGVVTAFVIASFLGADGRSIVTLTIGATVASVLSLLLTNLIAQHSRVGIDAAMAVSMAIFYGGGMVGLRLINHSNLPNRGGIDSYMFGNAGTMRQVDVISIAAFGALALVVLALFWKEIGLYCFDPVAAQIQGFSPKIVDAISIVTTTVAIVIGIKAVGMILMVAFAIMPPAAARQWTTSMRGLVVGAGAIGGVSGMAGAYLSISAGRVPTGPVVVLILFTVFLVSILASPRRSILSHRRGRRRCLETKAVSA